MARTRHAPLEILPRHQHPAGFAAVVLRGRYLEAGDTGLHRVGPGDVLIHHAFESHVDRFGAEGAEVLVVPLRDVWTGPLTGHLHDPDAIVRCGEGDAGAAALRIAADIVPRSEPAHDWPDLLARTLQRDPSTNLRRWADAMHLHPASLSRGFRQVFGVAPASFRRVARTLQAIRALRHTRARLDAIACDCGFADQAHMTRAVVGLTRMSPRRLRGH